MDVAPKKDTLEYYEFKDPTLNSFSEDVLRINEAQFLGKKSIPVDNLTTILDNHLDSNQNIDVMNIDVEGMDFEVLSSNDWNRYFPTVRIVEDLNFDPEKPLESKTVQFLKEKGYSLKANCLISLIFKKDS